MPASKAKAKKPSVFQEMIKDLRDLKRQVDRSEPVLVHQVQQIDGRMVVRKKRMPASDFFKNKRTTEIIKPMSREEVRQLRDTLALSQSAFARWLAASPGTIRQWEQTSGVQAGPALRLLHLLKSDLQTWRKRIHDELLASSY